MYQHDCFYAVRFYQQSQEGVYSRNQLVDTLIHRIFFYELEETDNDAVRKSYQVKSNQPPVPSLCN